MAYNIQKKNSFFKINIANDALQEAQIEMYIQAAYKLPFDIRILKSYEDAVTWFNNQE